MAKPKVDERLEAMLLEGLNSGTRTEMTSQDWEDVSQAVCQKITQCKVSNRS